MNKDHIRNLIDEGVLKVAPVRPRSVADIPRIRAALAAQPRSR
jgi:hypothetical protein